MSSVEMMGSYSNMASRQKGALQIWASYTHTDVEWVWTMAINIWNYFFYGKYKVKKGSTMALWASMQGILWSIDVAIDDGLEENKRGITIQI